MKREQFDQDYAFLALGGRDLLWKAIENNDDTVFEKAGWAEKQIQMMEKILARHRAGMKTTMQDIWGN